MLILVSCLITVMFSIWGCPWRRHENWNWSRMLQLVCWLALISTILWLLLCRCYTDYLVVFSAQVKVLVITDEALPHPQIIQLRDCLTLQISAQLLRSCGEGALQVPSLAMARLVGTTERVFSMVAPQLLHSLPWKAHLLPPNCCFEKERKVRWAI